MNTRVKIDFLWKDVLNCFKLLVMTGNLMSRNEKELSFSASVVNFRHAVCSYNLQKVEGVL